jgi:hypothetical protein
MKPPWRNRLPANRASREGFDCSESHPQRVGDLFRFLLLLRQRFFSGSILATDFAQNCGSQIGHGSPKAFHFLTRARRLRIGGIHLPLENSHVVVEGRHKGDPPVCRTFCGWVRQGNRIAHKSHPIRGSPIRHWPWGSAPPQRGVLRRASAHNQYPRPGSGSGPGRPPGPAPSPTSPFRSESIPPRWISVAPLPEFRNLGRRARVPLTSLASRSGASEDSGSRAGGGNGRGNNGKGEMGQPYGTRYRSLPANETNVVLGLLGAKGMVETVSALT